MIRTLQALALLTALGLSVSLGAGMADDPEAKALLARFQALREVGKCLDDALDGKTSGAITGPVGFGPGVNAEKNPADQAALFPEGRVEAVYIRYGPLLPQRGRFECDLRTDQLPADYNMLSIASIGTAGNTKLMLRLNLDRRLSATVLTKRESVVLTSDPVSLGQWHQDQYWYGPEGAVLTVDGVIADYSTDWSAPYAFGHYDAFYLGDQPWWEGKPAFYALDSFVGRLDNVRLTALETERTGK